MQYAAEPTDFVETAAPRTSTLAVASFVMSLICCIPGLGAIGTLLGVGAIVSISNAATEVRGKGLAVAGVVIGLLTTFGQIGIVYGINSAIGRLTRYAEVIEGIDANDRQTLSTWFVADLDATVTDEQLAAFRDAYTADRGAFVSVPQSTLDLFSAFMPVGQQVEAAQQDAHSVGYLTPIPLPVEFDQGYGLIVIAADETDIATAGLPRATNVGYVARDGSIVWLVDPAAQGP